MTNNPFFKKEPPTQEEKIAALRVSIKKWNQGEYQSAMKLCKKYGITDREFSHALVASMHGKL